MLMDSRLAKNGVIGAEIFFPKRAQQQTLGLQGWSRALRRVHKSRFDLLFRERKTAEALVE
ncbi:MAG: hypothetical protein ABI412_06075, partial [Sphingomicrobium sp.]